VNQTPEEKREAARVRRRWLNLGELLAIAGVLISALALLNSYRERTSAEAERVAAESKSAKAAATLILKATVEKDGNRLTLVPRDDSQTIQAQTIRFPAALKLDPVETTGDPRIERGWFEGPLTEALERAKAKRRTTGDARLPVLITTRFLVDGVEHEDRALYEVGYTLGHAFLAGTTVKLSGLSRVGPVASEDTGEKRLEAAAKGRLG
jgi:hypothetical protein